MRVLSVSTHRHAFVWMLLAGVSVGPFVLRATAVRPESQQGPQGRGQTSSGAAAQNAEADAHYRVALVAIKDGDLTIAARELAEAARLAPSNAKIWYNIGVVESKRSNPAAAVEHLKRALQLGLPADLTEAANDLLAEATYRMKKTGSDIKTLLYGVGFGMTVDQVLSRGERLGGREASAYGDRYDLKPREDVLGGEILLSVYFGSQGLQRIWVKFYGGNPSLDRDFVERFNRIDKTMVSKGFEAYEREMPPSYLRRGNPLPGAVRYRNGVMRASLGMSLEQAGTDVIANEMRLIIWDTERCSTCER